MFTARVVPGTGVGVFLDMNPLANPLNVLDWSLARTTVKERCH